MLMKPRQCIAARELLGITPEILAAYAGVSEKSVIQFDDRDAKISQSIIDSIQVALEYAGVEFLEPSDADHRLVQLRSYFTPTATCNTPRSSAVVLQQQEQ